MDRRHRRQAYILPVDYIDIAVFFNHDLFDELGLRVTETWGEWLVLCERVAQAGYVPIANCGDAQAFWAGEMGWLVRLLGDAYLRNYVPMLMSRPGDWDYEEVRNCGYSYQRRDLHADMLVVLNGEREFQVILEGRLDFRAPKFRRVYERLHELAQFFQPEFVGADSRSATQLFYTRKAVMCLMHSDSITGIIHDF